MNPCSIRLNTPPTPVAFGQVLNLLRDETSSEQFVKQSAGWSDIECEQFLYACRYHKVQAPVLQRLLAGNALAEHRLRGALEMSACDLRLMLQSLAEIDHELGQALDQANLPWIALKGLSYEQRYWCGRGARHARDFDIFVSQETLDAVLTVLRGKGFVPADPPHKAFTARRRRLDHAANMVRGDIAIDVHWQLRNPGAYRIDYDRVWRHSVPAPDAQATKRWLSEADDLSFILLSIAHDIQRGLCRLKNLLDVQFIVDTCDSRLNWTEFLATRTAEHTADVVLNALDVTCRVLSSKHLASSAVDFLEQHRKRLVCSNNRQAERLLSGTRGNVNNQRWFGQCYPELCWKSIVRFADRNILRPGRIPWALVKGVRRMAG